MEELNSIDAKVTGTEYVRQMPYVDENGIYVPVKDYVPNGCASAYRCAITKEMFVEAYNKWIKGD